MSTLKYLYKITRIEQCIMGSLAAWITALISDGSLWFNTPKVAVMACVFFGILGASLFHYGRCARLYRDRPHDKVIINHPRLLMLLGCIAFLVSIFITLNYLPANCLWVVGSNFIAIMLYGNFLDRRWPWKNLTMALVCTTPIVLGWFSGHRMHPIMPYLIMTVAFTYLAREIYKDMADVLQDRKDKRWTMVMHFGVETTLRITGWVILLAISALLYAGRYLPSLDTSLIPITIWGIYLCCVLILFYMGYKSVFVKKIIFNKPLQERYRVLDIAMLCLMTTVLMIRIS